MKKTKRYRKIGFLGEGKKGSLKFMMFLQKFSRSNVEDTELKAACDHRMFHELITK